jgi:hypothetical protein
MWRFFSSLCIVSIVAFLGLQRGRAEFLPERPQWNSAVDGLDRSRGARGACSTLDAQPVGRASAIPPPAAWAPPTEIAAVRSAGQRRSPVGGDALVWRSPAEIGFAPPVAAVVGAGGASTLPAPSKWAPPAEIASEPLAVEHRSAAVDGALVWRSPEEIASRIAVPDAADLVSSIPVPARWAPPAEIAPATTGRRESAARAGGLVWTPPLEIAGRADRIRQRV